MFAAGCFLVSNRGHMRKCLPRQNLVKGQLTSVARFKGTNKGG